MTTRGAEPGGHLRLGQHTQCETLGSGEGMLRPPSNPPPTAPLPGQDADGGRRPPNPRAGTLMAERRTVVVAARVTRAERAAWKEKAAAAGVSPSALLRLAMARTQTWTAPALAVERERSRQIARIGNNLNQLARWANTHASPIEAVRVTDRLLAVERSLLALARPDGEDGDAH